jgi:signal recognition particle subunit SRP54
MQQIKRLGPLDQLMKLIPGMGGMMKDMPPIDEKQIARVEAIIRSMTKHERRDPNILNGSRRKRIALGSGTTVQEVNRLITQYDQMRQMMRGLTSGKFPGMPTALPGRMAPAAISSKNKKAAKKGKGGGGGNRFRMPFGR